MKPWRVSQALAVAAISMTILTRPLSASTPPPGTALWTSTYDGENHGNDAATAVVTDPSETTAFVTGTLDWGTSAATGRTVAYDAASGVIKWTRGTNIAMVEALDAPAATLVLSGRHYASSSQHYIETQAINASTGRIRWSAKYDPWFALGWNGNFPIAVLTSGMTAFVVADSSAAVPPGGCSERYRILAYDVRYGRLLWTKAFDANCGQPLAAAMSPDGSRIYVAGTASNDRGFTVWITVVFSTFNGAVLWGRVASRSGGKALAVSAAGTNVYETGFSSASPNTLTIAYSGSTGTRLWAARTDGIPSPRAIAASPDGTRVVVTGMAPGAVWGTIGYDGHDGAELWTRTVGQSGTNNPCAIEASADSTFVYVTGSVSVSNGFQWATAAYRMTDGAQAWIGYGFYQPPFAVALCSAIAVAPDGSRVFTTAPAVGVTSGDYGTIAYEG